MGMSKADEFLAAAELCHQHGYANASTSRSYYAMYHAAAAGLEAFGITAQNWTHEGLQATFARELIHRRKVYPAALGSSLSDLMRLRLIADYSEEDLSLKVAARALRKAREFAKLVKEATPQ